MPAIKPDSRETSHERELDSNTFSIEDFGAVEYWFAMNKVVTIVAFLILGAMLLFGVGFPRIGLNNFTA